MKQESGILQRNMKNDTTFFIKISSLKKSEITSVNIKVLQANTFEIAMNKI